jgi:hypothetical protein
MLLGIVGTAKFLLLVQAIQPGIAGVVRDGGTGQPLAGAVVELFDLDRSVQTDSLGHYSFSDLPPGPQHLTIRRIGYAPRTLHALVPSAGRLQIDIVLHPIPLRLPNLVARSNLAIRGIGSGDTVPFPDRGVSAAAMHNDPLLAEPDGLLALGGGEVSTNLESPDGINVRGAAADETGYVLDGVPVFSPYHSAGLFSAWNPDALESLQLISSRPALTSPDALSGTVAGVTRAPGATLRAQGAVSTTQARMVVDGPIGRAGFLASVRTGFPGWMAPQREASYLRGNSRDLLAKLEVPALGGSLRFLLYDMGNSISPGSSGDGPGPLRNDFAWSSRSAGAQWVRHFGQTTGRFHLWSAGSNADAIWLGDTPVGVTARRRDDGIVASVERTGPGSTLTAGVRLERSRTDYSSRQLQNPDSTYRLTSRIPIGTFFVQHDRTLKQGWRTSVAVSGVAAVGGFRLSMRDQLRWNPARQISLSATYLKSHQLAQSLRNPESVASNVFPADLYIGAGARGVPVARSDRLVLAADYRPASSSLRLGVQAYLSSYDGLVLVAPRTVAPFATDGFTIGSGSAPGVSVDAVLSEPRFGLLARYSWQRVRLEFADTSYAPSYGNDQRLELGGIVFPSPTWSLRAGLTGAFGRRSTAATGSFEWEACNLLDQGCEFLGSPAAAGSLGGTRLPAYLRLDLGLRKHWHLNLGERDVMLAVFGTFTNVLGRINVLTVVTDPKSGATSAVEMRPRAPLVVGLDWRF